MIYHLKEIQGLLSTLTKKVLFFKDFKALNKSNTECGIIRPTNAFTWDHIHYLEVAINIL